MLGCTLASCLSFLRRIINDLVAWLCVSQCVMIQKYFCSVFVTCGIWCFCRAMAKSSSYREGWSLRVEMEGHGKGVEGGGGKDIS